MSRRSAHELSTWRLLAAVLLAGLALVGFTAAAQAQDQGTIEGRVVNGTAGGPAIGVGITVTLYVFQDQVEVDSLAAVTDTAGGFRFEGLSAGTDRSYLVEAVYLDVHYTSPQAVQVEAGQTAQATVTVYETTDDDSHIIIDSGHLVAQSLGPAPQSGADGVGPTMLRISELYLFGNTGDRTFVGRPGTTRRTPSQPAATGQAVTVRLPLPAAAVGLAFGPDDAADRYVQSGGELLDTEPVPPGQETMLVFFSYHLGVTADTLTVEHSYRYPLAELNVFAAQPGLAVTGAQLQSLGSQTLQGQDYDLYAVSDLAAGESLLLRLVPQAESAAPAATAAGPAVKDNQALLGILGAILAVAAAVAAVAYSLAGRRGRGPAPAAASPARQLLAELADLEDAFEAGRVDEETYRRERAARQEAIKSLWT